MDLLMTVTFAEHGGKTKLTVRAHRAGNEAVWTQSLDRLAEELARVAR